MNSTNKNSLVDLFLEQVHAVPNDICVQHGKDHVTYKELNAKSDQLAEYLLSKGITSKDTVPLVLEPGIEIMVAIFGILKSGAAFVPIDPDFPNERILYIFGQCSTDVVITRNSRHVTLFDGIGELIDISVLGSTKNFRSNESINFSSYHHLAYVIYTSGSTGKPKGVMVGHDQLLHYLHAVEVSMYLGECDSYAVLGTFSADAGYTAIFGACCYGKCLHILNVKKISSFNRLQAYFDSHQIDCYKITPSLLTFFSQNHDYHKILPRKRLIVGGEECPLHLAIKTRQDLTPECRFFNHYGPTETTIGIITYEFSNNSSDFLDRVPLGKPLSNVECYLLDEHGKQCSDLQLGELHVAGPLLARGYFKDEKQTRQKFVSLQIDGAEKRVYKTGDMVRLSQDGNIEFHGRKDDQIKLNGHRIELSEVEFEISKNGYVDSCLLMPTTHAGTTLLVGYVKVKPGFDQATLIEQLKDRLPAYMIPGHWIEMKNWPFTINNKIDRQALPKPSLIPQVDKQSEEIQDKSTRRLLTLWTEALPTNSLVSDKSYYELGGDSIGLIKLSYSIYDQFKMEIPPSDLYNGLTFNKLCNIIRDNNRSNMIDDSKVFEEFEVSKVTESQRNLFFQNKLNPKIPFPHSYLTFEITRQWSLQELQTALFKVVKHHESLQVSYYLKKGNVFKNVEHDISVAINVIDTESSDLNFELAGLSKAFNFNKSPLLSVFLIHLKNGKEYLHFEMPHINSDGESMKILVEDFVAAALGKALSPKSPFDDFQKIMHKYFRSSQFIQDKEYWEMELNGYHPTIERVKELNSGVTKFKAANIVSNVPDDIAHRISEFIKEKSLTRFQICLMAYSLLINYLEHIDDVVIILPVHNRLEKKIERTIGLVSNVVPIRMTIDTQKTFSEWSNECKIKINRALQHQRFPFEDILKNWSANGGRIKGLMNFFFGYHSNPAYYSLGKAQLKLVHPLRSKEDLPLSMAVFEIDSKLVLRMSSTYGWYTQQQLEEFSGLYYKLIDQLITADSDQSLATITNVENWLELINT